MACLPNAVDEPGELDNPLNTGASGSRVEGETQWRRNRVNVN